MDVAREALRREVLGKLSDLRDEAKRLEEFVLTLVDEDESDEPRPATQAPQPTADGEAPRGAQGPAPDHGEQPQAASREPRATSHSEPAPASPEARSLGAPQERQLSVESAPALVADIRRRLEADPIRALDMSYPPGIFSSNTDPRLMMRTCLLCHSVHTARLAMYVAAYHGYQPSTVEVVGLCALLHDVGMERVPAELFVKSGPLSAEEFERLRNHAAEGADMLSSSRGLSGLVGVVVPTVVRQHHERVDGSGYPDGLAEAEIHEFARLLALVEAYETMISPRPYSDPCLPYEAMEAILLEAFGKGRPARFDRSVATSFLRALSLYPIGSAVALTGGELAQVVGANADAPDAPHVRVLWGPDGALLDRPRVVDLREADLSVEKAVPVPATSLEPSGSQNDADGDDR